MHFKDRQHAGQQLAHALKNYKGKDVVVYALPRGGVVLGAEVAKKLKAPLDLLIPRKVGHPYNPEYAIAAVAESGDMIRNEEEVTHVDPQWFKQAAAKERTEAQRRRQLYLGGKKPVKATGKIGIIIDDGLATGLTMKVAIKELRHQKPKQIVVAVPVAAEETASELSTLADEVVVLYVPVGFFGAIGSYYQNFDQVSDAEVIALIKSLPT